MRVKDRVRGSRGKKQVPDELSRNVKRFRGGLIFKAHRLLYHSTPGLRVIKKKKTLRVTDRVRGSRGEKLVSNEVRYPQTRGPPGFGVKV